MNSDSDLALKPLAFDVLDRLMVNDGTFTKTDLMRSYHDTQCKTVHYRMSEMFDMGWIEYRDSVMSSKAIYATPKGQDIHEIVTDMLADAERV